MNGYGWSGLGPSTIPDDTHDPRCTDWRCPDCGTANAAAILDRGWGRKQCADCGMHGEAVHFDGMQQPCICPELAPLVWEDV